MQIYDGLIHINVRDCRACVAIWRKVAPNTHTAEWAANWEALEDDAIEEIEAAGGWVTMSGIYPISAELAARAEFAETIA